MKVIDLLNKIANGEEVPKKIKIKDDIWNYDGIDYRANDDRGYLFEVHTRINEEDLNEEIEIIEEDKKIEHLDIYNCFKVMGIDKTGRLDENFTDISNKINEIIDYLEENKND